jgi:hypothetical protein
MSDKPSREMILAEPAGRQMDVWVELFVMSGKLKTMWTVETQDGTGIYDGPFDRESSAINALAKETWLHPVGAKVGNFQVAWNTYSRDIAAAMQVVEELTRLEREPNPLYFSLTWGWWDKPHSEDSPQYWAVFDWKLTGDSHPLYLAIAETASHAICKAALLATLEAESPCVYPTRQE